MTWKREADGLFVGPSASLALSGGDRVVVSALWSDEDGVRVSVDAGDALLSGEEVLLLAGHLAVFADLPPPRAA